MKQIYLFLCQTVFGSKRKEDSGILEEQKKVFPFLFCFLMPVNQMLHLMLRRRFNERIQ